MRRFWCVIAGAAALVATASAVQHDSVHSTLPQRFTAVALSAGGPRSSPVAQNLDITITRWSTAAERRRLREAMVKGQSELLETLKDLEPTGRIRAPGNLGYDLHYAYQVVRDDDVRTIYLALDRPITVVEAITQPRTIDYPFTFIHLRMNGDGRGTGTLSYAARVIVDDDENVVEFERYRTNPIQLNEVVLQK